MPRFQVDFRCFALLANGFKPERSSPAGFFRDAIGEHSPQPLLDERHGYWQALHDLRPAVIDLIDLLQEMQHQKPEDVPYDPGQIQCCPAGRRSLLNAWPSCSNSKTTVPPLPDAQAGES